jgi:transposase
MLYLAIDQHSKQLTVNLRDEQGDVILKRQVSTEWERVRKFMEDLRTRSAPEGGFVAILEVCGFNDWLLKLLQEYGCRETVLIQPEKRPKRKTDRRDANALGELLWTNRQRLLAGKKVQNVKRVKLPSAEVAEDRQVTTWRKRLGALRTRTLNRIRLILLKHNLQHDCPTKGTQTIRDRKWLDGLTTMGRIDRLQMDQLLAQWDLWKRHIGDVEEEIKKRQAKNPVAGIVATIPGTAAYSSLALASRIGPIEDFKTADSLPNFWGLTPGCRNSGDARQRLGSITKDGSTMARFILGQIITNVLRRDPTMKAWYLKIRKRRGSKIARVAAMRRLTRIIWKMVRYKQPYQIAAVPQAEKAPAA